MEIKTKTKLALLVLFIGFAIIILWVNFLDIQIVASEQNTYNVFINSTITNSTFINSTTTGNGVFALSMQTVPVVINGIGTAISVIIGFGSATIGILLRGLLKKDNKAKIYLAVGMPLNFLFSLIWLIYSYIYLAEGGEILVKWAVKLAITGFLVALLAMMIMFLYIGERLDLQQNQTTEAKPTDNPSTKTTQPSVTQEPEEKDSNKNVNIFVNVS
jgi:hypothetical protein